MDEQYFQLYGLAHYIPGALLIFAWASLLVHCVWPVDGPKSTITVAEEKRRIEAGYAGCFDYSFLQQVSCIKNCCTDMSTRALCVLWHPMLCYFICFPAIKSGISDSWAHCGVPKLKTAGGILANVINVDIDLLRKWMHRSLMLGWMFAWGLVGPVPWVA